MATASRSRQSDKDRARLGFLQAMQVAQTVTHGTGAVTGAALPTGTVGMGQSGSMFDYWVTVGSGVMATLTTSTSVGNTMVLVTNNPTPPADDYFTPPAAQQILQMEAAGIDEDAPEDEQGFLDWLNRD